MKLAIVRQHYRPDGGAERFIARALNGLSGQKELDLSVITREWQGPIPDDVTTLICNPTYKGRIAREKTFATEAKTLWQGQFDLIQSHERIPGCDIYRAGDGVHKVWLEQRKRVLSWPKRLALDLSNYHKYVLNAEREMFQHPNLKAVICNSEMVKQEIIDSFSTPADKIHVIYNGIDCDKFQPVTAEIKTELRQQLEIEDKPTLIYVGSGFERKGVATAIRALAHADIDAQLLVIGKEKKLGYYQKLAQQLGVEENVIFAGVQKEPLNYYQAADALIHPALYDPFPNVILEAMACGLPILTSTKCGGAEFIEQGKEGYVADALDDTAFAKAIKTTLKDHNHITLGKHARDKVAPYSISYCSQQLVNLYNSL